MANKNPWIKYIALLVIALILLGVNVLKNKKHVSTSERIFDISSDDVTEITVSKDTLSVTLIKGDTTWVFAAPDTGEVNVTKVDQFLSSVVNEGEYTDYQTKNPEKYEQYNISDAKATKLVLKAKGDKKIELFASRSGSSWAHDYIRYADDPKVYITSKKIIYNFSERASFWRK